MRCAAYGVVPSTGTQSPPLQKTELKLKWLSRVRLFATPWTVAYQDPLSMGFSRQQYWSGLPLPSPEVGAYSSDRKFRLRVAKSVAQDSEASK